MELLESKLRSWGRSLGVTIPKDAVKKEHLEEGDVVQIMIRKKSNPVKETFGKLKKELKGVSTKKILEEADKELWDE